MTIAEHLERNDFRPAESGEEPRATSDGAERDPLVPSPAVAPSSPPWVRPNRSDLRAQVWVQITLLLVVGALLLYLMSIPRPRTSRAVLTHQHELVELRLALEDLRTLIAEYHADHGNFPGRGPDGDVGPRWLERQLVLAMNTSSDEAGERGPAHALRELSGVPANPVNGLSTVRFLAANEPWPSEADGRWGWLYRPATGEIRAGCLGTALGSGLAYYDL